MFQKSLLTMLMAGVASIALPAYAQSDETGRQEVAVQAFGSFLTTTTHNGVDNTATNSGGVLCTYRFFLSAHHGVEANYGYSRNTQSYTSGAAALGVKTDSHEISGAYVFRLPFRRVTPFALAGADFNLSHHVFMRAEYRGLVYQSPTYDLPAVAGLDRISHRAEPSIGFGYRF